MIIHLDLSVAELDRLVGPRFGERLSELLRAHRLGNHLVVFDRVVGRWIDEHVELSSPMRATATRIAHDYTQTGDLVRRCSDYIRVIARPEGTVRRAGRAIEMSFDELTSPYVLDRVALVVEDLESDGKLYDFLCRNLRDRLRAPPLAWEIFHGGGERTALVARHKVDDRRIVSVVADSDLYWPSRDISAKHATLIRVVPEQDWPLYFVFTPPCREAENLLPWRTVALLPSAVQRISSLDVALKIHEAESEADVLCHQRCWLHLDLKEGFVLEKLPEDAREWIAAQLGHARISLEEFEFEGFGDRIFAQVFANGAILAVLRDEIRTREWWEMFGEFVTRLTWIGAGGPRQFT